MKKIAIISRQGGILTGIIENRVVNGEYIHTRWAFNEEVAEYYGIKHGQVDIAPVHSRVSVTDIMMGEVLPNGDCFFHITHADTKEVA